MNHSQQHPESHPNYNLLPKWQRELHKLINLKTCFIIEGNVNDDQLSIFRNGRVIESEGENKEEITDTSLNDILHSILIAKGYYNVIDYDNVNGFQQKTGQKDHPLIAEFKLKTKTINGRTYYEHDASPEEGADLKLYREIEVVKNLLMNGKDRTAVILDFASRYVPSVGNMNYDEQMMFEKLFVASAAANRTTSPQSGQYTYAYNAHQAEVLELESEHEETKSNILFILVNKINDLPAWFYLDNPNIRILNIEKPVRQLRQLLIVSHFDRYPGGKEVTDPALRKQYIKKISDISEGFTTRELKDLLFIARSENIELPKIDEALLLLKYGIKDDPWKDPGLKEVLVKLEAKIKKEIKGQDESVSRAVDAIIRASSPLSNVMSRKYNSKPKAVLFLAGPSGTGKTELVKQLAAGIFGNEEALIRFDMSEYKHSHTDQKLLGAPPGYIGYEAGGQLTNAVKQKPFSILLFDEIEKADPSILDKFLQILDDGRMTDGKGETVYFNNCIICFTSNLGMYKEDKETNRKIALVEYGAEYNALKNKIQTGIKEFFNVEIQRPEILNRIGDNLLIFDFIREKIGKDIFLTNLEKIKENALKNSGYEIELSKVAGETLWQEIISFKQDDNGKMASQLEQGARGILTSLEKLYVTPLAKYVFTNNIQSGEKIIINTITINGHNVTFNEGN